MFWIVLLLGHLMFVASSAQPPVQSVIGQVVEDDVWYRLSDAIRQQNQQYQQEYENSDSYENEFVPKKRALALLSRWQPFTSRLNSFVSGGSSIQRPPMLSMVSSLNRVPQTRGQRPLGQPLRWGR